MLPAASWNLSVIVLCPEVSSLVSAYILSLILARSLRRHVIHLLLQCNYRGIAIQELSLKAFVSAVKCNDDQILRNSFPAQLCRR